MHFYIDKSVTKSHIYLDKSVVQCCNELYFKNLAQSICELF